jgi:hypothetical protein
MGFSNHATIIGKVGKLLFGFVVAVVAFATGLVYSHPPATENAECESAVLWQVARASCVDAAGCQPTLLRDFLENRDRSCNDALIRGVSPTVEVVARTLLAQSAESQHSPDADTLWQKAENACRGVRGSECSRKAMVAAARSVTGGERPHE